MATLARVPTRFIVFDPFWSDPEQESMRAVNTPLESCAHYTLPKSGICPANDYYLENIRKETSLRGRYSALAVLIPAGFPIFVTFR